MVLVRRAERAGAALPFPQGTRAPPVEERVRSHEQGPSGQRLASPTAVPAAGWAVGRTTGPHPACRESASRPPEAKSMMPGCTIIGDESSNDAEAESANQ